MTIDPRMDKDKQPKPEERRENKEHAELLGAFRAVAGNESGRLLLTWIMKQSGYKDAIVALNPANNEIVQSSTIYNAARRDFWCEIRQLVPKRWLNEIEKDR